MARRSRSPALLRPNERRIYVRRLDGSTFEPLQGTEGATQFFWSPDSRTLAFFKAGDLKRVDIGSTQSTLVARLVGDAPIRFGAWGTGRNAVSAPHAPLHRVLVRGGDLRPVRALDAASGETEQTAPVFLPDGRRYFYMSLRSWRASDSHVAGLHRYDDAGRFQRSCDLGWHQSNRLPQRSRPTLSRIPVPTRWPCTVNQSSWLAIPCSRRTRGSPERPCRRAPRSSTGRILRRSN